MSSFLDGLCGQVDQLIQLCETLQRCLDVERTALIRFDMEAILRNNIEKETAIARFAEEKRNVQTFIKTHLGVHQLQDVADCLGGEEEVAWNAKWEQWRRVWAHTRKLCIRNREFLALSQKNLEMIHRNLLDLFGTKPLYDGQGQKVKRQGVGQVMEAKA